MFHLGRRVGRLGPLGRYVGHLEHLCWPILG